jgi:hypothetical protein
VKDILLSRGLVALVDDADFAAVSAFKWHTLKCKRHVYAARNVYRADGTRTLLLLHKFLMPEAALVDHEDGNGLNCSRQNLRAATRSQNQQAFCHKRKGTSKFRGVNLRRRKGTWVARIQTPTGRLYLGDFELETDAARAYNIAAKQLFGKFASFNPL